MKTTYIRPDGEQGSKVLISLQPENPEDEHALKMIVKNPGIISELASLDFEGMARVLNADDSNDAPRNYLISVIEAGGYGQEEVNEDGDTYYTWVKKKPE